VAHFRLGIREYGGSQSAGRNRYLELVSKPQTAFICAFLTFTHKGLGVLKSSKTGFETASIQASIVTSWIIRSLLATNGRMLR